MSNEFDKPTIAAAVIGIFVISFVCWLGHREEIRIRKEVEHLKQQLETVTKNQSK